MSDQDNKWENIGNSTHRLSIIGGWLVMSVLNNYGNGGGVSIIFISDSQHAWKL